MNQGFRLRFDQMRENDPARTDDPTNQPGTERYVGPGYGRSLCLIWPDGKRMFLNYAYLLTGEFDPTGEMNGIKLAFSSHTVFLRGFALDTLFMALLDHIPRLVVAIDPRYVLEDDKVDTVIVEIRVEKREE